ncbi:MAG: nuclear transport factor 2 family protein [Polyangiales bacterium]
MKVAPCLCFAVLVGCGAHTSARTPRVNAIELLEVGINDARPEVIRPMIGEVYTQHNPRVSDGPEGLLSFVADFAEVPRSRRVQIENLRSFEDGEFVVLHSLYTRGAHRISGFDVFRVRNGLFVEHWDVGMPERGLNPSGRGLLEGATTDARQTADAEVTRQLATGIVLGLVGRDDTLVGVAENVLQHDPRIGDGRQAWLDSLGLQDALVHEELVRTLADSAWALTQSRGRKGDAPVIIYDLFHQREGEVVEHWVVWERVPARMRHNNGML